MFNILYRCPRTKMVRCTNRGVFTWSTSLPRGPLHTLRGANKTRKCHEQNGSADDRH
jgi:hypothetical protein